MSRKLWSLPIAALVLLFAVPGALASDVDPAIEQARKRKAEVNAELDVLRASDVELQREADRLEAAVRDHKDRAEVARARHAEVEASLGSLQSDVREAERQAAKQRALLRERAVAAYIRPTHETLSSVLNAADYDEAHRRTTLLGELAQRDADILRGKREAEAGLDAAKGRYESALTEMESLRVEEEQELAKATEARDRHGVVLTALETRIEEFQREADSLAAYEGQLVALINSRQTASAPSEAAPSSTTSAPEASTTTVDTATPGPGPTTAPPPTTAAPTTTTTAPPGGGGGGYRLIWPTSGYVTSPFGPRWGTMHAGIDIGASTGTPIYAAAAGTVIYAGWMGGYGNVVLIDHLNGLVTVYAHQSSIATGDGARVSQGQVIGSVGSTGNSTGPHLHFETRVWGTAVNPMQYL